jgi:hypothetical protein
MKRTAGFNRRWGVSYKLLTIMYCWEKLKMFGYFLVNQDHCIPK